jgi:hypothetical protein
MGWGGARRGDDQTAQAIHPEIGLGALGNELLEPGLRRIALAETTAAVAVLVPENR